MAEAAWKARAARTARASGAGVTPEGVDGRGGEEPAVGTFVLVHGAGADRSRFDALRALIPDAVAPDLPGHGTAAGEARRRIEAYADDVAAYLRRSGLSRPILVGHSMGAAIALTVALDADVDLAAVALIGGGARLRVHPDFLAATAARRLPDGLAEMMYGPGADPAMVEAERRALACAAAAGVLGADFAACDKFDARDRLGELRLPAAVIVGGEDRMTPPRLSEGVRAVWGEPAAVDVTVVDGAGHYVQRERPEAVAQALLALRARALGDGAGRSGAHGR